MFKPDVSSSEYLGENEGNGWVTHILTDTDTCPMWDHPTHTPTPPPLQLFSCSLTEWISLFLPLQSSLHAPSTPLTQTLTYATFSLSFQNDINCQAIVKICVSAYYSSYQRHFCTWCYTELHLSSKAEGWIWHIKFTRVKWGPSQYVLLHYISLLILPLTLPSSSLYISSISLLVHGPKY